MEVIGDLNSSLHKLFVTKYNKCTNDVSLKCLVPNCALDCLNQGGQVALEDDKSRFENETPLQDEVLDPGYVIKAMLEDGTKVIVNVYKSEKIGKPTLENRIENDGQSSKAWAIPHGFSHCLNHKGSNDNTFNFLVHPNTYRMGETNSGFYKMVNDLAMSELVKKFGFRVDGNLVYVDNAKYNDDFSKDSIQNGSELKPEMQSEMTSNLKPDASGVKSSFDDLDNKKIINSGAKGKKGKFLTPAYKIFCTTTAVSPENAAKHSLTIEVDLPLVKTAATISVNIRKRKLVLVTREPVMYKLEIELPEGVNKSSKQVHFDKVGRKFTVSLQYVVLKNGEEPRCCPESDTCASGDSFSLMHGATELPSISRDVSALTSTAKCSVHNHAETSSKDQTNHVSLTPRIPEYSGRVEPTALSFVFHVSGVKKDMTNFKVISPYSCLLELSSMDKCSKEMANFVCCFKFEEQCLILENGCMVDVSEHNVALIIAKDPHSSGNWDSYSAGATFDVMEKREFLTSTTLIRDLDNLDIECQKFKKSAEEMRKCLLEPDLKVTEMDNENLTMFIEEENSVKPQFNDEAEATNVTDIVVVHTKGCPRLQSILKQRTISESSDDGRRLSFSTDRLISTASDDVSESEDGGGFDVHLSSSVPSYGFRNPRLKKSVSFNERIDQAVFQANQTVSAMHAVLKNRRKRARKRDQYFQQKSESSRHPRRRCRSSGSISYEDSGDEPQVFASLGIRKGARDSPKLLEGDSVGTRVAKNSASSDFNEQFGGDEGLTESDGFGECGPDEVVDIENGVDSAANKSGNRSTTVKELSAKSKHVINSNFKMIDPKTNTASSKDGRSDKACTNASKSNCDVIDVDNGFRTSVHGNVHRRTYEASSSSTASGFDEICTSSLSDSPSADSLFAGQEIDDAFCQ